MMPYVASDKSACYRYRESDNCLSRNGFWGPPPYWQAHRLRTSFMHRLQNEKSRQINDLQAWQVFCPVVSTGFADD